MIGQHRQRCCRRTDSINGGSQTSYTIPRGGSAYVDTDSKYSTKKAKIPISITHWHGMLVWMFNTVKFLFLPHHIFLLAPWRCCCCRRRPQDRDWHVYRLIYLHFSSYYYLFRNVARLFQSRNRSQEPQQQQQQQLLSWPLQPMAIIDLLIS